MSQNARLLGQIGGIRVYTSAQSEEQSIPSKAIHNQPRPPTTPNHRNLSHIGNQQRRDYQYTWYSQTSKEEKESAPTPKHRTEPARRSQLLIERASEMVSKSNIKKLQQRANYMKYDPPSISSDEESSSDAKQSRPQSSSSVAFASEPSISPHLAVSEKCADETPRNQTKPKLSMSLGQSRSACFALEMSIQEQLREIGARPQGPCPLRLQVYRQALDEIADKYSLYGHLLRQIKAEYEAAGVPMQNGGLHIMYNDLVLLHGQLKQDYEKLQQEHNEEVQRTRRLMSENELIRKKIETKNTELDHLKQRIQSYDPEWQRQQQVLSKIQQLEVDDAFESATNPVGFSENTLDARAVWGHNQILEKRLMSASHDLAKVEQKERETSYRINKIVDTITDDILHEQEYD
eukprot:TRINITY_DN9689_c0_g1_i1.p1 TRINITY_DN9689_c0_g1~~TRINITY_DN9689_c0_g1_i1.p1  ORF type:complete len:405 (-),score=90.78 TRINITY_DN9689_c0_g1_i1:149-1363(-)